MTATFFLPLHKDCHVFLPLHRGFHVSSLLNYKQLLRVTLFCILGSAAEEASTETLRGDQRCRWHHGRGWGRGGGGGGGRAQCTGQPAGTAHRIEEKGRRFVLAGSGTVPMYVCMYRTGLTCAVEDGTIMKSGRESDWSEGGDLCVCVSVHLLVHEV